MRGEPPQVAWLPAGADDLTDGWIRVRSSVDERTVGSAARALRIGVWVALAAAVAMVAAAVVLASWWWLLGAVVAGLDALVSHRLGSEGLYVRRAGVRVVSLTRTRDFDWGSVAFDFEALPSSWLEWVVVSDGSGREVGVRNLTRKLAPDQSSPGYEGERVTRSRVEQARDGSMDALVGQLRTMRDDLADG